MKRCPTTGKRMYQTAIGCMIANCRRPLIARAYRCRYCEHWHLTRRA